MEFALSETVRFLYVIMLFGTQNIMYNVNKYSFYLDKISLVVYNNYERIFYGFAFDDKRRGGLTMERKSHYGTDQKKRGERPPFRTFV